MIVQVEDLFRIRNNTLEIFLTGLSHLFTIEHNGLVDGPVEPRILFICNKIITYLNENNLSLNDTRIILDCRMENFYMGGLGNKVAKKLGLDPLKTKILTSVHPKNSIDIYPYELDLIADINSCNFYKELIEENVDWENIVIDDRPILCLSGRPTEYRAKFIKNLLDLCGDKIRASFGNIPQFQISDVQKTIYKKLLYPYPFPLNQGTDNKVIGYAVDNQKSPGHNLFQSLLSIVNETNNFANTNIQLSEKSFKVFAWHQIPILMASPKQVETIRNLGFDMFDDIIDHSYDTAPNLDLHDLKVLNEVAKFLKKYPTEEEMNILRKGLYPRLKANNEHLYRLYQSHNYEPWPHYS